MTRCAYQPKDGNDSEIFDLCRKVGIEPHQFRAVEAEVLRLNGGTGHGQLDPRSALDQARKMLRYVESFNGQKWGGLDETVDRRNLATALDNLEETAAMLLNASDRPHKSHLCHECGRSEPLE